MWVQVAERYMGTRKAVARPMVMIISDEEIKSYDGNNGTAERPAVYVYTLDLSQNPKHLDARSARGRDTKKVYSCVYLLDGDKLLIGYNANGSDAPRPTGFDATTENGYCVLEFARKK
jgi:uncharacterized protein (TIGR03067 family)